MALRAGSSILQ
ncbi:rCG45413 [Rattus norvegicus]|uniref:RCG45413 n=1 Tax=Rattus norvegicus TaxID=10116 RepID=A6JTL0_RAT|nr:rCG45413 [Rattus norvegicus]